MKSVEGLAASFTNLSKICCKAWSGEKFDVLWQHSVIDDNLFEVFNFYRF